MSFYIYELSDPRDDSVFYVGKGKGNRINCHETEARSGRVSRKCDRIREIEAAGLTVGKRKVKHFVDEQAAYDYEENLIAQHGLANLTNVAPGGGSIRNVITISSDRSLVAAIAEAFNRTHNGTFTISVRGVAIDMKAILAAYKERIEEIAARRGREWVNMVARARGIEFTHGGA